MLPVNYTTLVSLSDPVSPEMVRPALNEVVLHKKNSVVT